MALTVLAILLRPDGLCAFCPRPPWPALLANHRRRPSHEGIISIKLFQSRGISSTGDYLGRISSDGPEPEEGASAENGRGDDDAKSPIYDVRSALSGVSSEVERRTSGLTSGLAEAAERGGSEIRSLASGAKRGVKRVAQRGARDARRTEWAARRAMRRTADGLASAGKGLADIHFFQELGGLSSPSVMSADEVAGWIESQARSGTEMVGSSAKSLVLNFTGKDEYKFGDVTKELMHRVASQEVNMQDAILLLKILVALGATIGPLADLLPFAFLIEALNLSLEQKVGGKILEVLSKTLDSRLVAALFTSDDKDYIGDVVKRTILGGVLDFTGKPSYVPGDIQRAVERGQELEGGEDMRLDIEALSSEFEEWDRMFVEKIETEEYIGSQAKIMDMKIAMALEECESLSRRKE